jgi:hypothetical protein
MKSKRRWICAAFALSVSALSATSPPPADRTFPSADDAVVALVSAVNPLDTAALRGIFGPGFNDITSPDPVQAENELHEFAAALNKWHGVTPEANGRSVLELGENHWPFPVPLVERDGRWAFDTDAGKAEIINRRIGRNELSTLQAVRAYVEAQREYAAFDRDGDGVLEYAPKFRSSPGKKDGLYWPPELDGEISPIGPQVVAAQSLGYLKNTDPSAVPEPFRGYYFKILTSQGKNAPGGKYDYIINGNMIGGFALVAYPAVYGDSGIMTFIVNQQGRVYEKDLGSNTTKHAQAMTAYDPDDTWRVSRD